MSTATQNPSKQAPVLLKIHERIATISLNRPHAANALDKETLLLLAQIFDNVAKNDDVAVVLIHGTGNTFCAGGDIRMFAEHDAEELSLLLDEVLVPLHKGIVALFNANKVIVSAVNGPVGGGGIGLALCADYVLAADTIKLRCGYSAIGLSPDAGSSWFLTRRTGPVRAKQLLLDNTALDAQACVDYGIVDQVYPYDELMPQAQALAVKLAQGPRKPVQRIVSLINNFSQRSLEEQLELERQYMVASGSEPAAQEGVKAFIEKRAPKFN